MAPFRRLLLDGVADGSLRAVDDPDEVATILANQVSWTSRHLRAGSAWLVPAGLVLASIGLAGAGVLSNYPPSPRRYAAGSCSG